MSGNLSFFRLSWTIPIYHNRCTDECPSNTGDPYSARERKKRSCLILWKILGGSNRSIFVLAYKKRPSKTYRRSLTPWTSAPYRVSLNEEVANGKISKICQSLFTKTEPCEMWREEDRELVITRISSTSPWHVNENILPSALSSLLPMMPTRFDGYFATYPCVDVIAFEYSKALTKFLTSGRPL